MRVAVHRTAADVDRRGNRADFPQLISGRDSAATHAKPRMLGRR